MSWSDAWHLVGVLVSDPASWLGAALAGWAYPVDRQTLVDMDTYDLMHKIAHAQGGGKGKKPKPYPRPWPATTKTTTKPSVDLTQDEIIAALRRAGHTAKLPGVLQPMVRPRDSKGRFVKVTGLVA